MWDILVVDDERVERQGIQYLIEQNGLPLQCHLAGSSIEAMRFLAGHPVDILLTDIKMPFMDGLSLATKAKALYPQLHIVVFSAYGEFEYAKRAIDLKVLHYILKPVVLEEFLEVMHEVIAACERQQSERRQEDMLLEGYLRSKQYEKEKALLDLLNGNKVDHAIRQLIDAGFRFTPLYMAIMNGLESFFEHHHEGFRNEVLSLLPDAEYLNLNEYQSVVFIRAEQADSYDSLLEKWEKIRFSLEAKFSVALCVVVGQLLQELNEVCGEFQRLDDLSDYKFFYHQGAVLVASGVYGQADRRQENIDSALDHVFLSMRTNDSDQLAQATDRLFALLNAPERHTVAYVKFICAAIVNQSGAAGGRRAAPDADQWINRILQSESFRQLHELTVGFLRLHTGKSQEKTLETDKRNIQNILQIIHTRYMENISLEVVAEQVYLSPGYVSGLFKKTVNESFVKYLTAYRLEKAKEYLLHTNMKIVDVARKVGYTDTSYFGMLFRNHFGTSPAKYREIGD